jgi:hypothetical protein
VSKFNETTQGFADMIDEGALAASATLRRQSLNLKLAERRSTELSERRRADHTARLEAITAEPETWWVRMRRQVFG